MVIQKKLWRIGKSSSSQKEINAIGTIETSLSGRSLAWKDVSLPTQKGRTLMSRVQIPATAPHLLRE
jgi:hypothetical protein